MSLPDYIWIAPSRLGYVDAWNGWYSTLQEAMDDAPAGVGSPWVLVPGENILPEEDLHQLLLLGACVLISPAWASILVSQGLIREKINGNFITYVNTDEAVRTLLKEGVKPEPLQDLHEIERRLR